MASFRCRMERSSFVFALPSQKKDVVSRRSGFGKCSR